MATLVTAFIGILLEEGEVHG